MSIPSRNATGKAAPGQIVNTAELDKLAFRPKKLGDIIDRVQRQEAQRDFTPGYDPTDRSNYIQRKKLTFEEWWQTAGGVDLNHVKKGDQWYGPFIDKNTFKFVWEAAQENL